MIDTIPKVVELSWAEASSKAGRSASMDEELKAWDFVRLGLWWNIVVVAFFLGLADLVLAAMGDYNADLIRRSLRAAALFSMAIWGGIGLVAIPMLVGQRMQRIWAHRRSERRAAGPGLGDDWIDGPESR